MTRRTPVKKNPEPADASAEQRQALVHNRGMAQGIVSRIQSTLRRAEADQTELTPAQVKVYQRSVESANTEFTRLHQEIIAKSSAAQRDEEDEHFLQFVDLYEEVSVLLESCLEKLAPALQPQPSASQLVSSSQQSTMNQQPLIIQPSLPRAIPTFDGRYEQWEKFKVMFKDVVDKSHESDRIKLYHLEKALIGDAAGLIDAKTITDGNYERAWQLLDERYSDNRRMVDRHLANLLGMKKLPKESYSELRSLVETFESHVENLKFLGQDLPNLSEYMVVFLIGRALDDETKKLWESTVKKGELPDYAETMEFLKERVSVLERCQASSDGNPPKHRPPLKPFPSKHLPPRTNTATTSASAGQHCDFCAESHFTFQCPAFNELSVSQRIAKVKEKKLCYNCLRRGHRVNDCPSKRSCKKCQRRHHSLLHLEEKLQQPKETSEVKTSKHQSSQAVPVPTVAPAAQARIPVPACEPSTSGASTNAVNSRVPVKSSQVFLLTALINVMDQDQQPHPCRALLDCGSQVSFITQSLAKTLRISTNEVCVPVSGIGSAKSTIRQMSTVQISSRCNNFTLSLSCLVSPKITGLLPSFTIDIESWEIPPGILLADPAFHKANSIDMLIGMDHFYDILKPGYMKLSDDLPGLHDSHFGWLVGGTYSEGLKSEPVLRSLTACSDPVNKLVQRFWEIESGNPELVPATEAEECEQHFLATYRRDESGRYMVQLPLRDSVAQLGDSRSLALRRFYLLESKLARNPDLKAQYDAFIEEYESLNHCKEIQESNDPPNLRTWYLPHHAVLRPSNSTTQCRVVYDASASAHGPSLNDVMMVGPTVQADLLSIILRFRMSQYVLSADIGKFYRQFRVDPIHTPLQRIFWRKASTDRLRVLELTTVTYGTGAAPFLATRALLQSARDEKDKFPLAARIIEENCYVDNVLFGSNQIQEAEETQRQLIALLQSGGMHLHKWFSNEARLLVSIPSGDRDIFVNIGDCDVKSELHELYKIFQAEVTQQKLFELCQTKETVGRTIPPSSPHFGGLWEAGVKSVKSVLKKVYQFASLTMFGLYTLLCQVEAILNSRPLFAHSNDPQDPEALTPAHLMIGCPLHAVPEPSYRETPSNRLSRWQYIQKLRDHFWNRWSREYLTELQVRGKWTQKRVNVEPGLIVLLKEENVPPQNWKLGRVETVYPGADGLVRVVDVKTKSATYKRPIHKLAPLPIIDNLTSSPSNPTAVITIIPGGRMFSSRNELKVEKSASTNQRCERKNFPPDDNVVDTNIIYKYSLRCEKPIQFLASHSGNNIEAEAKPKQAAQLEQPRKNQSAVRPTSSSRRQQERAAAAAAVGRESDRRQAAAVGRESDAKQQQPASDEPTEPTQQSSRQCEKIILSAAGVVYRYRRHRCGSWCDGRAAAALSFGSGRRGAAPRATNDNYAVKIKMSAM